MSTARGAMQDRIATTRIRLYPISGRDGGPESGGTGWGKASCGWQGTILVGSVGIVIRKWGGWLVGARERLRADRGITRISEIINLGGGLLCFGPFLQHPHECLVTSYCMHFRLSQ